VGGRSRAAGRRGALLGTLKGGGPAHNGRPCTISPYHGLRPVAEIFESVFDLFSADFGEQPQQTTESSPGIPFDTNENSPMFAALPHSLIVESGKISLVVCENGISASSSEVELSGILCPQLPLCSRSSCLIPP
jgi:hypothetical protein